MTMMSMFRPGQIGRIEFRNRIAMPALHLGGAVEGRPTAGLLDFYERRSRGGVGLITVGVCNTYDTRPSRLAGSLDLSSDQFVEPLAELAGRIKKHGAAAGIQLSPLGDYNAPNRCPDVAALSDILFGIGEAAGRAARAGFDFVELMISGGSFLSHFLSPAHNRWEIDGYSGGMSERLRAPIEALSAVRVAIGDDIPIFARIHGHEFLKEGYDNSGAQQIVVALVNNGISALNITGGGHRSTLPQLTGHVPPFAFAYLARGIRCVTDVPLLFGGRLKTPGEAESALRCSGADYVNVARAILVDPDWPAKAESGRADEIVPCMACGHCFDRVFSSKPVRCSLNPNVGSPDNPAVKVATSTKVLVVGAGPAGLQAAWRLCLGGCEVELHERSKWPGGRWSIAARLKGRDDLQPALDAFIDRLNMAGVAIVTNSEVTPQTVREAGVDLLVLATGAYPRLVDIPGLEDHPNVLDVERTIVEPGLVGSKVAIIGAGGAGVELAIHLASAREPSLEAIGFLARYGEPDWLAEALRGRAGGDVTILRRRGFAGKGVGRSVRWTMVKDMERLGVRIIDRCEYKMVSAKGLHIFNRRSEEEELVEADTIIVAAGYRPASDLLAQFKGTAPKVIHIGDARVVGNIGQAVRAAEEAVDAALSPETSDRDVHQ
jgi:2,4-dienoyl-CoA reductase-like NADH-dependent reductase (Old Yellow Enzyme family)/NADPH-dependent 2,4-dienoyl-CoA reductase/sulfur reductase-like enzyme